MLTRVCVCVDACVLAATGSDFDHCLSEHLIRTHGDFTADAGPHSGLLGFAGEKGAADGGDDRVCEAYTMLAIAEHLKKALSAEEEASFECLHGGERARLRVGVRREEFESVCGDVFRRALSPVDRVLENYSMKASEIDEVVLVGGTTRIPRIREMLRQHLHISNLNTHIDPDITVAVGAACVVD
jgi:molecular chaperone DnaK (HSP70)